MPGLNTVRCISALLIRRRIGALGDAVRLWIFLVVANVMMVDRPNIFQHSTIQSPALTDHQWAYPVHDANLSRVAYCTSLFPAD